jgi:ribosomal protein S12 methylthiotransferase accessory factor
MEWKPEKIGVVFMEIEITFPGGARVDANFGPYTIETDQPPQGGGEGSAPTPFAFFLSSIGTCAGIYVLNFLRNRGISTEGLKLIQRIDRNPLTGMVEEVHLEIFIPEDFPEKYRSALVRAAEHCSVKRHFEQPPTIQVTTRIHSKLVA